MALDRYRLNQLHTTKTPVHLRVHYTGPNGCGEIMRKADQTNSRWHEVELAEQHERNAGLGICSAGWRKKARRKEQLTAFSVDDVQSVERLRFCCSREASLSEQQSKLCNIRRRLEGLTVSWLRPHQCYKCYAAACLQSRHVQSTRGNARTGFEPSSFEVD